MTQPPPAETEIVEPGFVRPIRVEEGQLDVEDSSDAARADHTPHDRGGLGPPVRQIHAEQPVGPAGRLDDAPDLGGGPAQRLLAEHGQAPVERRDALLRVQGAGRGDHHRIEVLRQQIVELIAHMHLGSDLPARPDARLIGIDHGGDFHQRTFRQGLKAIASDPPDAGETQLRHRLRGLGGPLHGLVAAWYQS